MSYIKVETQQYVYLREPSNAISGFVTSDIVDCVILYILAPHTKKYFLAHVYRTSCLDHLSQIIDTFFRNEVVEIYISGGEFCNAFFPWNARKRHLIESDGNSIKSPEEIEKRLIDNYKNDEDWGGFLLEQSTASDFYVPYYQCLVETKKINVLDYFKPLKKLQKVKKMEAYDEESELSFKLKNLKDSISYQNITRVLWMIFNLKDIVIQIADYYPSNSLNFSLIADFKKGVYLSEENFQEFTDKDFVNLNLYPEIERKYINTTYDYWRFFVSFNKIYKFLDMKQDKAKEILNQKSAENNGK